MSRLSRANILHWGHPGSLISRILYWLGPIAPFRHDFSIIHGVGNLYSANIELKMTKIFRNDLCWKPFRSVGSLGNEQNLHCTVCKSMKPGPERPISDFTVLFFLMH